MGMARVAFARSEARFTVINLPPDSVLERMSIVTKASGLFRTYEFVVPIAMRLDHVVIHIGEIERETRSPFNHNVTSAVVRDLKAPGNSIVLGKDRVRKYSSDVGDVVIELHLKSRHIRIVAVCCWESRN